ncbi:hypothetical protein PG993_011255 [Apiospora rasikravindrae]|uniref:Uncharacterized protein n=1 Tax=Apiospora rasikravindrae TaxID=990691 RepID=A0ABR1SDQ2_9PEZI
MSSKAPSKGKEKGTSNSGKGKATNEPDESRAQVLFRVEDVQKGPGFGDRLRAAFDDFVKKLEDNPDDCKIGTDDTTGREVYGNPPAKAFLQEHDNLIKSMTEKADVSLYRRDLGAAISSNAGPVVLHDYVAKTVLWAHKVRTRNLIMYLRHDPRWLYVQYWRTQSQMFSADANVYIHELYIALDCLVVQARKVDTPERPTDEFVHEIFVGVYRMSPLEAAELVRHAILRGETWAEVGNLRQQMHMHINNINAYLNWRHFMTEGARRAGEGIGYVMRNSGIETETRDWLFTIDPLFDVYLQAVYTMARCMQQNPRDSTTAMRIHQSAVWLRSQLMPMVASNPFMGRLLQREISWEGDHPDTALWAKDHNRWQRQAARREPHDVDRTMLPAIFPDVGTTVSGMVEQSKSEYHCPVHLHHGSTTRAIHSTARAINGNTRPRSSKETPFYWHRVNVVPNHQPGDLGQVDRGYRGGKKTTSKTNNPFAAPPSVPRPVVPKRPTGVWGTGKRPWSKGTSKRAGPAYAQSDDRFFGDSSGDYDYNEEDTPMTSVIRQASSAASSKKRTASPEFGLQNSPIKRTRTSQALK